MNDTPKRTKEVHELRREIHQLRWDFRQLLNAKRMESERLVWTQRFGQLMEKKPEAPEFQAEHFHRREFTADLASSRMLNRPLSG
jgi:hypothetical protein